ncbi:alpha/beta fold hydrolase [Daejeonella sp.]|uniref:alpha/beta hydrolase n=1 Tax=Daejeonella sp. TaxID=2805397 RepID=UPI0030C08BA4
MALILQSFLFFSINLNPISVLPVGFYARDRIYKAVKTEATVPDPREKRRKQILKNMERVMGKLPARRSLVPFDIKIIDSVREASLTRYNLTFSVAKNERISAYLYVPFQSAVPRKLAAMLVLHGTDPLGKGVVDGQGGKSNRAHARELAERGYVVIAPDYPSFGDMKDYNFETDRYESATMQGIFNHMRCIDLLQSRKDVDPGKIGVAGLSLGGHNSMFVAAFDERIKVAVSASGWTQFEYYNIGEDAIKRYGGRLGPWAQNRYMPLFKTKYNLDGDRIPFNFDNVISAIAPRAFFSVSPTGDANFDIKGVRVGIDLAKKTYAAYGAEDMLQVRYPDAGHDFPVANRKEAYVFIDKVLGHSPRMAEIK